MNKLTLPLYGLLVLTPLMIAIGQLLFKMASEKLVVNQSKFYSLAYDPIFIGALAIYGSATLIWIYVLKVAPLAYAYSFMALTFVLVPILASLFLGETITVKYMIGASLIILGLLLAHM